MREKLTINIRPKLVKNMKIHLEAVLELYNENGLSSSEDFLRVYKPLLHELETMKLRVEQCESNLNKYEIYAINNFYKLLAIPIRNPNLEIKDGQSNSYYDRRGVGEFWMDYNSEKDYIRDKGEQIIRMFSD